MARSYTAVLMEENLRDITGSIYGGFRRRHSYVLHRSSDSAYKKEPKMSELLFQELVAMADRSKPKKLRQSNILRLLDESGYDWQRMLQEHLEGKFTASAVPGKRSRDLALTYLYQATGNEDYANNIVMDNIRLVRFIAEGQFWFREIKGIPTLPIDDLVNEGVIGFRNALKIVDTSRPKTYTDYIARSIRRHMQNANMNCAKVIRIPIYKETALTKTIKKNRGLIAKGKKREAYERMREDLRASHEEMGVVLQNNMPSLDRPLEDGATLGDFLEYSSGNNGHRYLEETYSKALMQRALVALVRDLPQKQREVIELLYPLDDSVPFTPKESALRLRITPTAVGLRRNKALNMLRKKIRKSLP